MTQNVEDCAIMRWLGEDAPAFAAKAMELRDAVSAWLSYIPQTFPHYTSHTVDHSDEIVRQVSGLLFTGSSPEHPVLTDLSAIEAYIVIAAAYLHDAGMVVSDREKVIILDSEEWKRWASDPHQKPRLDEVEQLRQDDTPASPDVSNFLADRQLRFLIAEYVRREHHYRVGAMLEVRQQSLGRYAFDDSQLARCIANVCVGHGLGHHELADGDRYPDEIDLLGQKANVRLCAILLRLGDLLDLRTTRACPLLLDAACPLPADSTAHWSQYESILHRNTAPDRIALTAECRNPEEHRKLRDWCQWIEEEVTNATWLMRDSRRHADWHPPLARLGATGDPAATIHIRPAASASYHDVDWTFTLDEDLVFDRLIRDTYVSEWDFVRELLQNALDATRCKMAMDLESDGHPAPADPRDVDAAVRATYPVFVSLESMSVRNEHTGHDEVRPIVIVEDSGLGMDSHVISNYLLQIGRSWYESTEFTDNFHFVASSKFGLGFLSTFAISSQIEIETLKAGSFEAAPLRLLLTGPRNYILVEDGARSIPGTRVAVHTLKAPPGPLIEMIRSWCQRTEFPIVVREGGVEHVVPAYTRDVSRLDQEGRTDQDDTDSYFVRSFPLEEGGVSGDLYVLAHIVGGREIWGTTSARARKRREARPTNVLPVLPSKLICFGGIAVAQTQEPPYASENYAIDCRRPGLRPVLSRMALGGAGSAEVDRIVRQRWEEILREHIADREKLDRDEDLWKYKQRLAGAFGLPGFWARVDGMVPLYQNTECSYVSFREASEIGDLWLMSSKSVYREDVPLDFGVELDEPRLYLQDTLAMCPAHQDIYGGRGIASVVLGPDDLIGVKLVAGLSTSVLATSVRDSDPLLHGVHAVALPAGLPFMVSVASTDRFFKLIIVNESHELGAWCARMIRREWTGDELPLDKGIAERLLKHLADVFRAQSKGLAPLNDFLDEWAALEGLSADLYPPRRTSD